MNKLALIYNSFISESDGDVIEPTWLNGRSYSDAFVICIGAGPWRFSRRKLIQQQALDKLAGRDLIDIQEKEIDDFFPLEWQRKFLSNIISTCLAANPRYDNFCFNDYCKFNFKSITNPDNLIYFKNIFYKDCGAPKGAKVLSLFLRDAIKLECCFPIDRHVKRWLEENKLPTAEDKMINLCLKNGISPRKFAIGVAREMKINNPDWSI